MKRPDSRWPLLAAGWLLTMGLAARADEPPQWHPCRIREWPGRLYYGRGGGEHTFERAGYPNEISRFAHPSNTHRYFGYYVGGSGRSGKHGNGRPLTETEGTWGWDYGGLWGHLAAKIQLLWTEKHQSGEGHYKIDGPPVKDIGPYIGLIKEGPAAVREIKENK
jgi:hypothetical protein